MARHSPARLVWIETRKVTLHSVTFNPGVVGSNPTGPSSHASICSADRRESSVFKTFGFSIRASFSSSAVLRHLRRRGHVIGHESERGCLGGTFAKSPQEFE